MKKILSILVIISLLMLVIPATSANEYKIKIKKTETQETKKELQIKFSEETKNNLKQLNIKGVIEENIQNQDLLLKTKKFNIDKNTCEIKKSENGLVYLSLEDSTIIGEPGEPILPMKTFAFKLPKNSEIKNIGIKNPEYYEIENKMIISLASEPKKWENQDETIINQLSEKMQIYNYDNFLPGKLFDKVVGTSNDEKIVYLQFYPIQYLPKQAKTILINSGEINIYYEEKTDISIESLIDYENLIITSSNFYSQAKNLKQFHQNQGTLTEIVNTSWIKNNYEESVEPLFEGYKNDSLEGWNSISNYDYSLARKIIKFLNDTSSHPNLKYVTLFGDSEIIPPSYYYHFSWTPTDFFYSSPDLDLIPNYHIGRLPVKSIFEAEHIVNKIINWDGTTDLFENITLSGGQPFGTSLFIGELITVDSINRGFFKGAKIEKQYETDKSFTKEKFVESLKGENGFVYNIAHGGGNLIEFQRTTNSSFYSTDHLLYSEEILNLPESNNTPVVVSIACSNGAYDSELYPLDFNYSIGEALLHSQGGGISYIGGSRSNLGSPIPYFDKGKIEITKETYMAGLLTYVFEEYSKGGVTLGNITTNARLTYIQKNNMESIFDLYTYFAFILLGDPALKLPEQPVNIQYEKPSSEPLNPVGYITSNVNGSVPIYAIDETNQIKSQSNSPYLNFKFMNAVEKGNLSYLVENSKQTNVNDNFTYDFTPETSNLYSIRIITKDGKETWQYLEAFVLVDDDFNIVTPGYKDTKFSEIQDAIDNTKDNEGIYVFNGTYNENIIIDKILTIIGENKEKTIVQSNQDKPIISIQKPFTIITGLTVKHSGILKQSTGILVENSFSIIQNNIIMNNKNGIKIVPTDNKIGFSSQVVSNEIINNENGIYQENNGLMPCLFMFNNITNNKNGIYLQKSRVNLILFNSITDNKDGIYFKKSKLNFIVLNDFIDNNIHAHFVKSKRNLWAGNYWDNWIGLKFDFLHRMPKYVWGRNGLIFGLIPSKDKDRYPAIQPYNWNSNTAIIII